MALLPLLGLTMQQAADREAAGRIAASGRAARPPEHEETDEGLCRDGNGRHFIVKPSFFDSLPDGEDVNPRQHRQRSRAASVALTYVLAVDRTCRDDLDVIVSIRGEQGAIVGTCSGGRLIRVQISDGTPEVLGGCTSGIR